MLSTPSPDRKRLSRASGEQSIDSTATAVLFRQAYIVDDDWRVRDELKRLLKAYLEIEEVGERDIADKAFEAMKNLSSDPLFLDIQCPEKNGFDLSAKIPDLPQVIFNGRRRGCAANCLMLQLTRSR